MSETIFRFFLDELQTFRVRCNKCRGVVEVQRSELYRAQGGTCKLCNAGLWTPEDGTDPLRKLLLALEALTEKASFSVECVIPQPPRKVEAD